jgi:hypothetical protein
VLEKLIGQFMFKVGNSSPSSGPEVSSKTPEKSSKEIEPQSHTINKTGVKQ